MSNFNPNQPPNTGILPNLLWCIQSCLSSNRRLNAAGGGGSSTGNATSIQSISVIATPPTDTQLLRYVASAGKWEPGYLTVGDLLQSSTANGVVYTNVTGDLQVVAGAINQVLSPSSSGVPGFVPLSSISLANSIPTNTGAVDLRNQTTVGNIVTYSFPPGSSNGTFMVGGYINVTAIATNIIQFQVVYTDETNTVHTRVLCGQNGNNITNATTVATVVFQSFYPIYIRVLAGTTITISTINLTNTGTNIFDTGGFITQLS